MRLPSFALRFTLLGLVTLSCSKENTVNVGELAGTCGDLTDGEVTCVEASLPLASPLGGAGRPGAHRA